MDIGGDDEARDTLQRLLGHRGQPWAGRCSASHRGVICSRNAAACRLSPLPRPAAETACRRFASHQPCSLGIKTMMGLAQQQKCGKGLCATMGPDSRQVSQRVDRMMPTRFVPANFETRGLHHGNPNDVGRPHTRSRASADLRLNLYGPDMGLLRTAICWKNQQFISDCLNAIWELVHGMRLRATEMQPQVNCLPSSRKQLCGKALRRCTALTHDNSGSHARLRLTCWLMRTKCAGLVWTSETRESALAAESMWEMKVVLQSLSTLMSMPCCLVHCTKHAPHGYKLHDAQAHLGSAWLAGWTLPGSQKTFMPSMPEIGDRFDAIQR